MGLQGSGKSTFYRQHFAHTHTLVSKDNFPNNRHKARRQRQLIEEALQQGKSVLVDNTNPTRAERAEVISLAEQYGIPIRGYVFLPDVALSLSRSAQRVGKACIPDVGIYATAAKWQSPSLAEGFAQLFAVTAEDGTFSLLPWREP